MNTLCKLGVAALALGAVTLAPPLTQPSQAQPGYSRNSERREQRRERRTVRRERRQVRRNVVNTNRASYTGTVTRRRSDFLLNVRVGGSTYNVYSTSRLPRAIDGNDLVRVYGRREGYNNIRNASVTLIRNG
jgi:hypothetical protein